MNRPIRVLFCIETISSGGVEQTRLTLVKHLPKTDFEIKIICTNASGPIADGIKREGVELFVIGSMKNPFDWKIHKKVQDVIKVFKPDIIHGGVFEGNSMAAISGFLRRVPVIILEETSDPQNRSAKASWLLRQYVRVANKIIAISPDVENYLVQKAKIPTGKVTMINNGVTTPNYPSSKRISAKRKDLGLQKDDVVVGFVGRLFNDHKRVTDLLEAVARIDDPKVKVLIVGDGRDKGLVVEKLKGLGLLERVIMAGYQNETTLYYSMMDIFCVPSAREGFGLVAAEAMLHHLPVVASNVGGLKNVVIDGETGYLVAPKDPVALADKIKSLIMDPEKRKHMGEMGYQRSMQHYTATQYSKNIQNLYTEQFSPEKQK
jgi:glycosyltransferase involved in cell wall biosynthesis